MDVYETDDALRRRYEPCSIIPIGPAGENLVKSSVTFVDKAGTIGRGGLPAVMGSKNLKAIVVQQGKVPVSVADRRTFHRLVNNLHDRIMRWPNRQLIQDNGLMPAPPDMTEIHQQTRRPLACPSCPLADKVMVCLNEGDYAGVRTYMPHLSVNRFNAGSSREAYQQSIKYSDTLNRFGVGGTNFSSMFASLVDLYQKGIITQEDTGGIELKNDIETALELIRMAAYRQGFGEVLAEGPAALERMVGERAVGSIHHIKGYATVRDPRLGGLGTMEFEQLTTPRGAHVAAAGSPSYDPGRPLSDFVRHGERMGVSSESLKRLEESSTFNPGRYSKYSEDWYALFNCLSLCNRAQVNRFYHIDNIAAFYKAVTGIDASPQELMQAAERAWTIGKLLNVREGFDRRHDHIPEAWFQPLVRGGEEYRLTDYDRTTDLTRKDLEQFLDDYYDERGYDRESGLPTRAKLRELGLEYMAKDLDLPETA
jgi:aldehyde:ferredoxin oxidoreductase